MYHSKKIGVFISHIMGFYQQNICQGIIDKAAENGYTAEIFTSIEGDESILKIPNFHEFSGVVFASDTYSQNSLKEQISITLIQKCSCPVIDITGDNDIFPSITLEHNNTTGDIYNEEGQHVSTSLTSVSFPVYELGSAAVEALIKQINGESIPMHTQIPAHTVPDDSCGYHSVRNDSALFYQQAVLSSIRMSVAFQNVTDIDDGMNILENYIRSLSHCHEFYLCLYDGWDSVPSHISELTEQLPDTQLKDEIHLKLAICNGKRLPERSFTNGSLLPEYISGHSDAVYLYMPLFFKNKEFGYAVLSHEHNRIDHHVQLMHWIVNINQMLQHICETKNTNTLVTYLEELHTKDTLTGLLNLQGYMHREELMLNDAIANGKTLTGFIFDMHDLRYINDTFGHNEGNFAIQIVGHALSDTIRPDDICARFIGDKFYLLSENYTEEEATDLITRVQKYLNNYNQVSHKVYDITATGCFARITPQTGASREDLKKIYALAEKAMSVQKKAAHTTTE